MTLPSQRMMHRHDPNNALGLLPATPHASAFRSSPPQVFNLDRVLSDSVSSTSFIRFDFHSYPGSSGVLNTRANLFHSRTVPYCPDD